MASARTHPVPPAQHWPRTNFGIDPAPKARGSARTPSSLSLVCICVGPLWLCATGKWEVDQKNCIRFDLRTRGEDYNAMNDSTHLKIAKKMRTLSYPRFEGCTRIFYACGSREVCSAF